MSEMVAIIERAAEAMAKSEASTVRVTVVTSTAGGGGSGGRVTTESRRELEFKLTSDQLRTLAKIAIDMKGTTE